MQLTLKQYKSSGVLVNKYNPLHNLMKITETPGVKKLSDFSTSKLSLYPEQIVDVTCQPSYDGTVNLIINDDRTIPKIINSKFTKIEDNQFRVITRNQKNQTNVYDEENLESDTSLFLTSTIFPKVHLATIGYNGQLMGGNYTFYIKYCDDDYNETDIIAESGQIAIFKGTINNPKTISGCLADERTDKSITLKLTNLDTAYKKLQLYFVRRSSDLNGVIKETYHKIVKPYDFKEDVLNIVITGFETMDTSSYNEINMHYNIVSSVKTQAQVQNMLFFGNVSRVNPNNKDLAAISYYIQASLKQNESSIGNLTSEYTIAKGDSIENTEYYNPKNIYYYLGYWPEEMYRFGVVYLMKDGSRSPVYNLRGCKFEGKERNYNWASYNKTFALDGKLYESSSATIDGVPQDVLYDKDTGEPVLVQTVGSYFYYRTETGIITTTTKLSKITTNKTIAAKHVNLYSDPDKKDLNYMDTDYVDDSLDNTYGVFKNYNKSVYNKDGNPGVYPLYYSFEFRPEVVEELQKRDVVGFYIVRQKRIANILGQGLAIGVLDAVHAPVLYSKDTNEYWIESFVDGNYDIAGRLSNSFTKHLRKKDPFFVKHYGLLSLDAMVTKSLQSTYDGEEFLLKRKGECTINIKDRVFAQSEYVVSDDQQQIKTRAIYVDEDVPVRMIDDVAFSTRLGSAESVMDFAMENEITTTDVYRGITAPFIGTTSKALKPYELYNIMHSNYSEQYDKDYVIIRGNDQSPFYAVSDRYGFEEFKGKDTTVNVYRGDCYSNTVTIRMMHNFIDSEMPVSDTIVDKDTWKDNYHGYYMTGDEEKDTDYGSINRADLNAVPLGSWITYKCLSNYNLGLRSVDRSYVDEMALMGNERAFYPLRSMNVKAANKIEESHLLNAGYNSTVGAKVDFIWNDVPYQKDLFDNRVMFSNAFSVDSFKNGYRVFPGLSYKDIDRQYGAITKLEPWGRDLLCIFEHGVGILPINQKALQSTTAGQSIQIRGVGVLSSDVSVISQDFGSIWKDSIIRTPMGVYGVDTYAKKIWRVPLGGGAMECISDLKIQQFLNDNLQLSESDSFPTLALKNVVSHYNNYKGDVMFTFYNIDKHCSWNICYNERSGKWITKYTWLPLLSANINNQYYSFDKNQAEIYSIIYNNLNTTTGIRTHVVDIKEDEENILRLHDGSNFSANTVELSLQGYDTVTGCSINIDSIESYYLDNNSTGHYISSTEFPYTEDDEEEGIKHYEKFDWLLPIITTGDRTSKLSINGYKLSTWFKERTGMDNELPVYIKLNVSVTMYIDDAIVATKFKDCLGFLVDPIKGSKMANQKDAILRNAFYVHGNAGVFDEINYNDASYNNQILPCKWYGKQEPFELEFVVNGEVGLHKIFNDLVIISNNVQPKELEMEIVGDVYQFNKKGIFRAKAFGEDEYVNCDTRQLNDTITYKASENIINGDVVWDTHTNEYGIRVHQNLLNIKDYGRIKGNIHYKEDSWYITLDPLLFKKKYKLSNDEEEKICDMQSTRLRDKYIKIRVKYSGENLVLITALRTMYTLSYA